MSLHLGHSHIRGLEVESFSSQDVGLRLFHDGCHGHCLANVGLEVRDALLLVSVIRVEGIIDQIDPLAALVHVVSSKTSH